MTLPSLAHCAVIPPERRGTPKGAPIALEESFSAARRLNPAVPFFLCGFGAFAAARRAHHEWITTFSLSDNKKIILARRFFLCMLPALSRSCSEKGDWRLK
jgi:hypothetical protein